MSNNNSGINLTIGADINKSVAQINSDLEKIEKKLNKLKVKAGLDTASKAEIKKQIEELTKKKNELSLKLKLANANDITKQLQQISSTSVNVNVNSSQIIQAQQNVTSFGQEISATAAQTGKLNTTLGDVASNAYKLITAQTALQSLRNIINDIKETLKETDQYITNISMITNVSRNDASEFVAGLADKAIEYKADISDVEKAAETITRTGQSIADTNILIEDAVKLAKVGFSSADATASSLVTIANGFGLAADEMERIADIFVTLDSKSNTTASKLSEAVSLTASNAKLAGVEINRLSAYLSTLRDMTPKMETELATALNAIFSRTYNIKLNKYLLETEDGIEDITQSLSNVETMLSTVGIRTRDTENTFRDFNDILDEVAEHWNEFSNTQQQSIATVFAGTMHKNTFISLISNWERVNELTKIAADSTGQLQAKYEAYSSSMEANAAELTSSIKAMWNNLFPSDALSEITQGTTALVQFIDRYRVLSTLIKTLTVYGIAKGFIAVTDGIKGTLQNLKNLTAAFAQLNTLQTAARGTQAFNDSLTALGLSLRTVSDKQLKLILSTKSLSTAEKAAILQTAGLTEVEAMQKIQTLGLASAEGAAAGATLSLSTAMSALSAVIKANPLGIIMLAVGAVITAFEQLDRIQQEEEQKAREAIEAIKEKAQAYENEKSSIDALKGEYLDIINSNKDEAEKTQDLITWKKKMVDAYGDEKEAIEKVNAVRAAGLGLIAQEE